MRHSNLLGRRKTWSEAFKVALGWVPRFGRMAVVSYVDPEDGKRYWHFGFAGREE